jgi:hypothetical protein
MKYPELKHIGDGTYVLLGGGLAKAQTGQDYSEQHYQLTRSSLTRLLHARTATELLLNMPDKNRLQQDICREAARACLYAFALVLADCAVESKQVMEYASGEQKTRITAYIEERIVTTGA